MPCSSFRGLANGACEAARASWKPLELIGILLLLLLCGSWANAQTGASLLPENWHQASKFSGADASAEAIVISGASFDRGYRLRVNGTSRRISDASLSWEITKEVNQNENLRLSFWVRKLSPLDGNNIRGFVSLENPEEPGTKSLYTPFPCDSDTWTKYAIPFRAAAKLSEGRARLVFVFAHGPQTFEIGGIALENLGPTPPLDARSILPENVYQSHYYYIDSSVGGSVRTISVGGQPFTQGYEISHYGDSNFVYRSGLGWRNAASIAKGDLLLLSFWARKVEPADGELIRAQILFERASGNFEKSLNTSLPNDSDRWRQFTIPFRSSANFAGGEAQLVFQFAYGPQKFEVGGISLVNYGQNVRPDQLPAAYDYPTRGDANAAWRIAANNRIERYRKGSLTIKIVDRDGNPVPGASVDAQQLNHAFRFGSAVTAARLTRNGTDNDIYRSRVSSHFTSAVFENDLKWGPWECTNCSTFNAAQTRAAIDWLAERGLPARGHNLIWPSWSYMPSDVRNLNSGDLRTRIEARFNSVMRDPRVNGRLYQWDVINEPYTSFDVMGRIGGVEGIKQSDGPLPNNEMIRWFQLARSLDPRAVLFVNDFDILGAGGQDVRHQSYLFTLTRWLLENGAPVDGVGLQGHFNRVTAPTRMESIINRFSELPVVLAMTEFDFDVLDEDLQADYTRDVLRMIFSQPKFEDFLMWGFWEQSHWLPDAAMYRSDWSSKPNALAWNDLLFREWWSNESGISDGNGSVVTRGFKGAYNIAVNYGRVSQMQRVVMGESSEVRIVLDMTLPRMKIKREGPRQAIVN
jgi:GH35 family endo-1,4-beta-xylanase